MSHFTVITPTSRMVVLCARLLSKVICVIIPLQLYNWQEVQICHPAWVFWRSFHISNGYFKHLAEIGQHTTHQHIRTHACTRAPLSCDYNLYNTWFVGQMSQDVVKWLRNSAPLLAWPQTGRLWYSAPGAVDPWPGAAPAAPVLPIPAIVTSPTTEAASPTTLTGRMDWPAFRSRW